MKDESCAYCDFIGPVVADDQPVRDGHRQWHEVIRAFRRAFLPLYEAIRDTRRAAANTQDAFALWPPPETKGDSK